MALLQTYSNTTNLVVTQPLTVKYTVQPLGSQYMLRRTAKLGLSYVGMTETAAKNCIAEKTMKYLRTKYDASGNDVGSYQAGQFSIVRNGLACRADILVNEEDAANVSSIPSNILSRFYGACDRSYDDDPATTHPGLLSTYDTQNLCVTSPLCVTYDVELLDDSGPVYKATRNATLGYKYVAMDKETAINCFNHLSNSYYRTYYAVHKVNESYVTYPYVTMKTDVTIRRMSGGAYEVSVAMNEKDDRVTSTKPALKSEFDTLFAIENAREYIQPTTVQDIIKINSCTATWDPSSRTYAISADVFYFLRPTYDIYIQLDGYLSGNPASLIANEVTGTVETYAEISPTTVALTDEDGVQISNTFTL